MIAPLASAEVVHDQLYVGYQTSSGPVLEKVSAMPSFPGSSASATDMGASLMPGVKGSGTAMIDSMTVFGPSTGDTLYLANANGLTMTNVASPGACTSGLLGLGLGVLGASCGDWFDATPTAWNAKSSLTTSKTSDLEPADRAVPGMAVFNGRLYAARNTVDGPQLWSCSPSGTQCNPSDWALAAPNSVGDTQLTQFNDPDNAAITLLAATSQHLYVGFNNAARGVVVYRAALPPAPANPSAFGIGQFEGRLGGPAVSASSCTGPSGACPGFGDDGLGLGLGATRIFDGKVYNLSGAENLYLATGDGTSPVRIYRATR